MYLGEQLVTPSNERMRLSAQLGVRAMGIHNVALGGRGQNTEGFLELLQHDRRRTEDAGLRLEIHTLDMGSVLLDFHRNYEKAAHRREHLVEQIFLAGKACIPTLKYNLQFAGIARTGMSIGRGGVRCPAFFADDVDKGGPDREGHNIEATLGEAGRYGLSVEDNWKSIEFVLEAIIPAAEKAGVRLACHPHDPPLPPGGLVGAQHVLGSLDGLRRLMSYSDSRYHALNFCQATIGEMSETPQETILAAIEEFGSHEKIAFVHFRNIKGRYLNFYECFPDDGDVDMLECVLAYRRIGYQGFICPDHVPYSDTDPDQERFFAFSLGYMAALFKAADKLNARH